MMPPSCIYGISHLVGIGKANEPLRRVLARLAAPYGDDVLLGDDVAVVERGEVVQHLPAVEVEVFGDGVRVDDQSDVTVEPAVA